MAEFLSFRCNYNEKMQLCGLLEALILNGGIAALSEVHITAYFVTSSLYLPHPTSAVPIPVRHAEAHSASRVQGSAPRAWGNCGDRAAHAKGWHYSGQTRNI